MRRIILVGVLILIAVNIVTPGLTARNFSEAEKEIIDLIHRYNKYYERKNIEGLVKMVSASDNVIFFGADASEIATNMEQIRNGLLRDFQVFDHVKFQEIRNLSIQISAGQDLATALYELPADVFIADMPSHLLFRIGTTWKKENGRWYMVQYFSSIPTQRVE